MRAPVVLVPQFFGSVVFDRSTSRYVPFDTETTEVFRRTSRMPIDALLDEIDDPERRRRVDAFFEDFYRRGFFTLDGRFAGDILAPPVPADHLAGPLALHLEVVAACNLTCSHCFAGALPRRERPLTLVQLDGLFAEMARLGTFRLGLTGGEPLLRRDLFEIIDLALAHGLCPCLTTNGLLITEEIAREFGRRELAWLNVSLDGATAETNDRVRGAGTFDRVVERLAVLGRHARFTLAFTLMSTNVGEVRECAELAARVGAHAAVFRPLYPVGVARHHPELMPTFAEYTEAIDVLAAMQVSAAFDIREIDAFGPRARDVSRGRVHQNYGCGAGNLVCSVSVSGDVNPCSFLGPEFAAANLRERSLADIWHDSAGFRAIRALPGGEPASAHGETATFAGGCRARALVLNGSINAPDPWIVAQVSRERAADVPGPVRNPLRVIDVVVGRRTL
jgi:radical SAM protein with 4Fe4S-binding SPASM domain